MLVSSSEESLTTVEERTSRSAKKKEGSFEYEGITPDRRGLSLESNAAPEQTV